MTSVLHFNWREYQKLSFDSRYAPRLTYGVDELESALTGLFAEWGKLTLHKGIWPGDIPPGVGTGGFAVRVLPGGMGADLRILKFRAEVFGRRADRGELLTTLTLFRNSLPISSVRVETVKRKALIFAALTAGAEYEYGTVSDGGRTFYRGAMALTGTLLTVPEALLSGTALP